MTKKNEENIRKHGIDFIDVVEMFNYPMLTRLDKSFFKRAKLRMPKRKKSVSLRLDPDVLDWFKHGGRGYQTRINAVLQAYVEAHQH